MLLPLLIYSVSFVLIACVGFEIYRRKISTKWGKINKIPGPPGWPVIGNLFEIMTNSENLFKKERKRSLNCYPIFKLWSLHQSVVYLLKPEDVELVLSSMKHSSKSTPYNYLAGWLGTGLLTSQGEKWQARRKILTPSFHFNILKDFCRTFNEVAESLVAVLKSQTFQDIDVMPYLAQYALIAITKTSMGTSLSTHGTEFEKYHKALHKMAQLTLQRVTTPWQHNDFMYSLSKNRRTERKILNSLHKFSENLINERERTFDRNEVLKKQSDSHYFSKKKLAMLDLLLCAKFDGKIDYYGIREEVNTFVFEGHDTVAMAIGFSLLLIANHKHVQARIVEEIKEVLGTSSDDLTFGQLQKLSYLERCIKEVLRLYPSVGEITRVSDEEFTTTTGYTIPYFTIISIRIYDIHRNPNLYPDPDKFDPDRFLPENCKNRHPFAYIPFSAGPRNCIGQKYAMLELKTIIVTVLRNFILEPVDKPEDVSILTDFVLRPKNGIKVRLVPKND